MSIWAKLGKLAVEYGPEIVKFWLAKRAESKVGEENFKRQQEAGKVVEGE